ncbi:MAG: carbohydrate kinase [Myxococcaceae bacterium]
MRDVICIGEALVDFLPERPGRRVAEVETWTRCSGGSPANVAVGVARLGGRSALIGVVGADEFGDFLKTSLATEGVDVSHVRQTEEGKTGLVFISLTETGERSFSFHRTRAAEQFLDEREIDADFLSRARAIHCGTNSLLWDKAQTAMLRMLRIAKGSGRILCCDPNLRLHLWPDPEVLRNLIGQILPMCSVVKLSEDEIEFVVGTRDVDEALTTLNDGGVPLPMVTLGSRGAAFLWQGRIVRVPAPSVPVVDTTGAGDGFTAAFLFGLTRLFPDADTLLKAGVGELRELATFACQVGSTVVQKMGAVAGLPRLSDVEGRLPGVLRSSTRS